MGVPLLKHQTGLHGLNAVMAIVNLQVQKAQSAERAWSLDDSFVLNNRVFEDARNMLVRSSILLETNIVFQACCSQPCAHEIEVELAQQFWKRNSKPHVLCIASAMGTHSNMYVVQKSAVTHQ